MSGKLKTMRRSASDCPGPVFAGHNSAPALAPQTRFLAHSTLCNPLRPPYHIYTSFSSLIPDVQRRYAEAVLNAGEERRNSLTRLRVVRDGLAWGRLAMTHSSRRRIVFLSTSRAATGRGGLNTRVIDRVCVLT